MKTRSGPCLHLLTAAALAGSVLLTGGCASKTNRATRLTRPPPPVTGTDEILRHQNVAARTRQLIDSGKYKTPNEARKAAEREYPAVADPASATWSAEYAQWEKQKAEQEKFEADFAKSIRQP